MAGRRPPGASVAPWTVTEATFPPLHDRRLVVAADQVLRNDPHASGALTAAVASAPDAGAAEAQILHLGEALGWEVQIERADVVDVVTVVRAEAP